MQFNYKKRLARLGVKMKKEILKVAFAVAVLSLAGGCQYPPTAEQATFPIYLENPSEGGFSQEGLDSIQNFMETTIQDGRIPSAIAMIAKSGKIVWLGTAGEMGQNVPMRRDAIVPLASVGKMYTAAAAMILYERGVLSLDDPVSKYIPEFGDVKVQLVDSLGNVELVAPESPVTVFHMLTHTGGIKSDGDAFWSVRSAHAGITTTRDYSRALAQLPLQSQPGESFSYGVTGSSYEVLAAIIEIVSGQTLEAFMFENIFDPLALENTFFYLPEEKTGQLPAFYKKTDKGLQLERGLGEDFPRSAYFHGGGGVQSSPQDILKFASIFLNGGAFGESRILQPETVQLMMTDHLGELATFNDPSLSWGFGASVRIADRLSGSGVLQQYGWIGGNYAILWVDPSQELVGYFAFPVTPPGDGALLFQYQQMVYGAMTEQQ